jgi:hypothetical protein
MNENIKYAAKLSGIAFLSFFKINILGIFSTLLVIVIEFFLITKSVNAGVTGHTSAIPFMVLTFINRPVGSLIWYLTCFLSPIIIFSLGNKYILSKISNKLTKDKSETVLVPLLDKAIATFKNKQPEVLRNAGDYALSKARVLNEIQEDKTGNKWLRKSLIFAMRKINFEGENFTTENLSFSDVLKSKTLEQLNSVTKPSRKFILIFLGLQWLLLLFIWLTKY